jgi:hypothetical protein
MTSEDQIRELNGYLEHLRIMGLDNLLSPVIVAGVKLLVQAAQQSEKVHIKEVKRTYYDPRLDRKEFREEAFQQLLMAYSSAKDPRGLYIMLSTLPLLQAFENIEAQWEGRPAQNMDYFNKFK